MKKLMLFLLLAPMFAINSGGVIQLPPHDESPVTVTRISQRGAPRSIRITPPADVEQKLILPGPPRR